MISVTATSEKTAQTLISWRSYDQNNRSYWWELRVVGWIAQNPANLQTTLYFKWQIGSHNYWPYVNESHQYSASARGQYVTTSFNLAQDTSNTYINKSSAQRLSFGHDISEGTCTVSVRFQGYKCFGTVNDVIELSFPTLSSSSVPEIIDSEGVPIVNDTDPKYYIYADDDILYSLADEDYYVINPKLTLELNQIDSLEFTLPPNHALYSKLMKLKTTIEVRQGKEVLFRGRVLDDDVDFYNRKTVHCEGALSFLSDTIMEPYAIDRYKTAKEFFKAAIDQHYSQVPSSSPKRKIKYVRSDVTAGIEIESEEYQQTSDVIRTLIDDVGGYFKLEYYDNGETGLSYLSARDHTTEQIVDFGDNLLDLTQVVDASEVYTSVVCLGKRDENTGQRLAIGTGNDLYVEDEESIKTYGRIIRVFTYDEVESVNELRALAIYLLAVGIQQSITITVKAIDLHLIFPDAEKIRVGDYVKIRSTPHSVDSYYQCSRIDLDLQNPENTSYTFGATIKALTNTTSKK